MRLPGFKLSLILVLTIGCVLVVTQRSAKADHDPLDQELSARLNELGFTGRIETTLEQRLGRHLDQRLANLGRLLWFDTIGGLNNDNTCGGCHSPTNAFGDTQSIAIGIENNGIVGPHRVGPRNQRRTPMAINAAFFPNLMWNSRFASLSGDPFNNSAGFIFPQPEGFTLSYLPQLLDAQAFIPPTERVEVAGFAFPGDNFAIRAEVLNRLNAVDAYRKLFGDQKKGALLFFGTAGCVACHKVSGQSNEMFSDFSQHVIGVPQIAPAVGDPAAGNVTFDGPGQNEDFGLEQITGDVSDRYKFRTSPLRNVALQPTFFHNGAFTRLEDAIRHHLDVLASVNNYNPATAGVAPDLRGPLGPMAPVLARLDPLLVTPIHLTEDEFRQLVDFVTNGLLDPRAKPENLRKLVPKSVPSGRPTLKFEFE